MRNKQILLEDAQKEIQRLKDLNGRISQDNAIVRREIDKSASEAYEIRKEVDYQQNRNLDLAASIRDLEIRVKDKDDQLYAMRKDLDS